MSTEAVVRVRCDGPGDDPIRSRCTAVLEDEPSDVAGTLAFRVQGLRLHHGWRVIRGQDLCPACQRKRYEEAA